MTAKTAAASAIEAVLARAAEALGARGEPELRAIGATLAALPGATRDCAPARAPACAHLDAALALAPAATRPLADAIAAARPYLAWRATGAGQGGGKDRENGGGAGLAARLAHVELAGPEGAVAAPGLRVGLHLQAPRTDYPPHAHDAEEFYLVLAGTALWRRGRDGLAAAGVAAPPGSLRRHRAREPHAMATGAQPLLALWIWRGAIDGRYWFV